MVYQVKEKADLDNKLQEAGSKLVVVDFFATWCGPCKIIAPQLEELAASNEDVVFLKVDVDECEDVAAFYKINCMPTFIFLKNGQQVDEFAGANIELLMEKVAKHK